MTDEEKVEEYYEDNECYSYLSEVEDFEEVFGFVKDRVKQAYLDGLAEGRKEKCLEQNKDGTIRPCEVMKENEQLKEQIEKMECCMNCNKMRTCLQYIKLFKLQVPDEILVDYGCIDGKKWECIE